MPIKGAVCIQDNLRQKYRHTVIIFSCFSAAVMVMWMHVMLRYMHLALLV